MGAPLYPTARRSNRVAIAAANAGQRGGTGASTGIAGVAAGTQVQTLRIAFTASNAQTILRVFKHDGTNYALLFEVNIPENTIVIGGKTAWSTVIGSDANPLGIALPSTSYTMRYSMETADSIVITEEAIDF